MPNNNPISDELMPEIIEIVSMLSEGYSIPAIAFINDLKMRTVDGRVERAKYQFKCKTHAHLVAVFLRNKLIK